MKAVERPNPSELNEYYKSYLDKVPEQNLMEAFIRQIDVTKEFFSAISDQQALLAYQPGKWTIKEVLGHLCDTERILTYRALTFARRDQTALPGFEENDYVNNAGFKDRTWSSLCEEKMLIRQAGTLFFQNLSPESLDFSGLANANRVNARSLMFFIIAHERHHLQVIKDRYLKG